MKAAHQTATARAMTNSTRKHDVTKTFDFESERRTGPLDQHERAVLARLFKAGGRLELRHVLAGPGHAAPHSTGVGLATLQGRGWVRTRKRFLELTDRFAVEMPALMDPAARKSLLEDVSSSEAAYAAAFAPRKDRCWSIEILFMVWVGRSIDPGASERDKAEAELVCEDLLALLDADGLERAAELRAAVACRDRGAVAALAHEGFDGVDRDGVLAVLERHGLAQLLRPEGDDDQPAIEIH